MIDNTYGIKEETIASIGEFTINWNLFEKYYCHNEASEQKIISLDLNPFSEMRPRMDVFRVRLIDHFRRHNQDYSDDGLQAVLFTKNRKLNYKEKIRAFLENQDYELHNGMICIYRIRNNLLHGEKEVFDLNEQSGMIQAASDVLSEMTIWKTALTYGKWWEGERK